MRSEEYLSRIRESAGLRHAVLKKITVGKDAVTFSLVTDVSYREEDVTYAESVTRDFVPPSYEAKVSVVKSVPDASAVRNEILGIFKRKFPSVAAFLRPEDVEVSTEDNGGRFLLYLSQEDRERFRRAEVLDELTRELCRKFCGVWNGVTELRERAGEEIEHAPVFGAEKLSAPRLFEIREYVAIDGAAPKFALYCADLQGEQEGVTLCGKIVQIEERKTKKDKPYFRISLADGSGTVQASYFSRKETLEKIRALKAGDSICITGEQKPFNGSLSFTAKKIDYGMPPSDFIPVERESRSAPPEYSRVFPEPVEDLVQADLFDQSKTPEEFKSKTFVVFDLETTGLNNSGAVMDRIIEIGAVKISEGRIAEKFSTFVSCPVKLSREIRELTGIDDEMLLGAPDIKEAIADFFKFSDGCILVGHNVSFDSKFIRYYGEKEGFLFRNRQYDTLTFAQEMLRLNNYKLNTVASHYGFEFRHHRAFDDAFVTAKIFLQLVKEKGGLPQ